MSKLLIDQINNGTDSDISSSTTISTNYHLDENTGRFSSSNDNDLSSQVSDDIIVIPSMRGLNLTDDEKKEFKKNQSRLINLKKYREDDEYRNKIRAKNLEYARQKYDTDEYRKYMNEYMKNNVNKTYERKEYMRSYMKKYMKDVRDKKKQEKLLHKQS